MSKSLTNPQPPSKQERILDKNTGLISFNRPNLPPPPPPNPPKQKKRSTISIQITEWNAWSALKFKGESWTSVMTRVRTGWETLKNISITVNAGMMKAQGIERVERPQIEKKLRKSGKADVMKEMRETFSSMENIKDMLEPVSQEILDGMDSTLHRIDRGHVIQND